MRKKGKKLLTFIVALAVVLTTVLGTVPAQADTATPTATGTPYLMYHWGLQDSNGYWDGPNENSENTELNGACVSNMSPVFFYYVDENGVKTSLEHSQLTTSNSQVVSIGQGYNYYPDGPSAFAGLTELSYSELGTAYVRYTHTDGNTYEVKIVVDHYPPVGIYDAAQNGTFSRSYTISETNDTFYVVTTGDWKLDTVTLQNGFSDIATVSIDASKTFATVKVTGTPENGRWYDLSFKATTADGGITEGNWGIELINAKPALMFRWGMHDNDQLIEDVNNGTHNAWYTSPGNSSELFFYYTDNGSVNRVLASDLSVSDSNVLTLSQSERNGDATFVEAVGFGNATVDYIAPNGKTYSVKVVSQLSDIDFYSQPVATQANYISNFKVTDTDKTFYLVAKDGSTLSNIVLRDGLSDFANYSISSDGTYVAITVTGVPENGRGYAISCDITRPDGNVEVDRWYGLTLFNGMPYLGYRNVEWGPNGWSENLDWPVENNLFMSKGDRCEMFFKFVVDGAETALVASDIKSADESVVKVYQSTDIPSAVIVEAVDFGSTAITYELNGKTYSMPVEIGLPDFGFYTSPTASEQTFINEFTVTDTDKTYYFSTRNGWELTRVSTVGDLSQIGTVTLDSSGTFATITITGTPFPGMWAELEFDAVNTNWNDNRNGDHYSIQLKNGMPVDPIYFQYQDWEMLPTYGNRIDSEVNYLDEYSQEQWATIKSVSVKGDAVKVEKIDEGHDYFWAVEAVKLGSAEVTITHVDPKDQTQTIDYTFTINVVTDGIGHSHKMLSGVDGVAVPGDVLERELIVTWDHYNETTGEVEATDISDVATYNWMFDTESNNFTFSSNKNIGKIIVGNGATPNDWLHYGCDITYTVNGKQLYTGFGMGLNMVDRYYQISATDLPADYKYAQTATITPIITEISYDYATGTKSTAQVKNDVYLQFWGMGSDVLTLSCGTENIPYDMMLKYDADAGYTATRGAFFTKADWVLGVDVLIMDANGEYEYIGDYHWGLNVTTCPHTDTEVIDKVDATCTEGGYTGDTYCNICQEIIANGTATQPKGHNYATQTVLATCTTEGYTTYTCSCGDTYTADKVAALGHTTVLQNDKAATCTEAGYTGDQYCTVCKTVVLNGSTIPATGHTHTSVVTAPTCTTEGYTTYTCSCGDSYVDDETPATGHTHTSVVTAPTCTTEGYTTYTCACGDTYTADKVAALGHTTVLQNDKAETCTDDGYTGDQYCTVCKTVVLKGSTIAATGHSHTSKVTPATCTVAGSKVYTCACGDTYTEVLQPVGHIFSAGKCSVCQTADPDYKPATEVETVVSQTTQQEAAKATEDITNTVSDAIKEAKAEAEASGATLSTEKLVETVKEALTESKDKDVKAVVDAVSEETMEKIIVAVEEEKEIITTVVAQPVSEEVIAQMAPKDVEKIEKFAGNHSVVAQYLDLSVLIQAKDADGNVETLGTVDEPTKEMTFTLTIPENLRKEGRTYYIILVHDDGAAERVKVTNNGDGTVSFKASKFSTYALAYTDQVAPKTSDMIHSVPMATYIVLFAAVAVLLTSIRLKRMVRVR